MDLPESVFRFWAFMMSLGPDERWAMEYLELDQFGIMDLFEDPDARPRDGLDIRLHGRFFRDPPEFLTFMSGGTDGLHYGLWFDDGRTCSGVARYFTNDGGGVGVPAGTPLEAVREELEETWLGHFGNDIDPEDFEDVDDGVDLDDIGDRLGRLRETLVLFETTDRPELGEQYVNAYVVDPAVKRRDPGRFMTLDGGGAFLPAGMTLDRPSQPYSDDVEWCAAISAELTGPPERVESLVQDARRRCAEGDPGQALVLGRDLHWINAGDPVRQRQARDLLVLAYHALARPSLAGIVEATYLHRERHIRSGGWLVDVLRGTP